MDYKSSTKRLAVTQGPGKYDRHSALKQAELRAALRVRGLDTHGTTQELEVRLARDDACGFFFGNLDAMNDEDLREGCQSLKIPSRCEREALIQRIRVYKYIKTERLEDEESEGENTGLPKKDD